MSLPYFFDLFTTFGAVALIILTIVIFVASYSSSKNAIKFTDLFAQNSKWLILAATFAAIVGSLIYSEILKFDPCGLCWWQRIFIYPVFFIALVSIIKKDKNPFQYINPLMWLALITSLYHNYLITVAGKTDAFLCNPQSVEVCSDRYVEVLSVVDIPFMALSIILFILTLSFISGKKVK